MTWPNESLLRNLTMDERERYGLFNETSFQDLDDWFTERLELHESTRDEAAEERLEAQRDEFQVLLEDIEEAVSRARRNFP